MGLFDEVKQNVTVRQAAERYGLKPNRSGLIRCIFHNDKSPSMKVDRRYYCFGCGCTGDAIDFTAQLFDIGLKDAAMKLADDFGIPYSGRDRGSPQNRRSVSAKKPEPTPEELWQKKHLRCLRAYLDYLSLLLEWKEQYAPKTRTEEWHEKFMTALRELSVVEYYLDTIVNACDAGREGELIFRLVYEMTGCRKPVLRLWISSMEDSAIREGFSDLRPGTDYEALYQSALCRQKADWLVGINATRLFSVLYHRTLNVGRVQTPTLAMLAERDAKITLFHKEKYHLLRLTLDGAEAVSEKFTDSAEAEQAAAMCKGAAVTCTSVTKEQKKEQPPKLYDLTTLQREANRLFGYTAKQTLDYAQSLYEKKLLTYPRTDSRYLTSDMAETASCVIHLAAKVPPFDGISNFFPLVEAMISDKDISDHHAIIPTMEVEKADIKALPLGERNLFLLVCCKLLCASAEPYVYEAVTATFDCGGHTFTAKGKRILSEGWREIDRIFRTFLKEKPADGDGGTLPDVTEGQIFDGAKIAVTEHFTQPPKPYTDVIFCERKEWIGIEERSSA